jgi:hypothetical protein
MPLEKLANQDLISGCRDMDQDDRQVTGNGMRPQPRLSQTVLGYGVWLSQLRVGENDRARQAIE